MKTNQIIGIVLLVVGCALFYYGRQESQAINSQIVKAFSGSPTDRAMWMMIGGGASAVAGLFFVLFKR